MGGTERKSLAMGIAVKWVMLGSPPSPANQIMYEGGQCLLTAIVNLGLLLFPEWQSG